MSDTPGKPVGLWIEEEQQDILAVRYRVRRTLFSERSEFQKIDVVETAGFGRMLFIDGLAMVSERDEFIYHEMISHVPLFVHPSARRVLVIGGGDGGTVREVLRHPAIEHCRLVEIDPVVIEACRRFLPSMSAALDDPRVEVTVADGVRFVAETDERYDLVLVDSTDPIGPATPLFGPEFYGNVARVLNDGGVVVSQAESPHYESKMQRTLVGILAETFPRTGLYNYSNLTYPGGLWSFSYATAGDRCPVGDFDPRAVADSGLEFRYYGAEIHRAAFALPGFQQVNLEGLLSLPRRSPAGR